MSPNCKFCRDYFQKNRGSVGDKDERKRNKESKGERERERVRERLTKKVRKRKRERERERDYTDVEEGQQKHLCFAGHTPLKRQRPAFPDISRISHSY